MPIAHTDEPTPRKPLRLWPGVLAVVLLWVARFGLKVVVPGFKGFSLGMIGGLGGALAVLVWWAFFSRAPWSERLGAILLMIVGLAGTWNLSHESMGSLWLVGYAVPGLCLALVAGAAASRRLPDGPRRATMAATILLACGVWALVRTEGISGDHVAEFGWRWAKSPEERLLARAGALPPAPVAAEISKDPPAAKAGDNSAPPPTAPPAKTASAPPSAARTEAEWPGFRGPKRDGVIHGVRIETDWSKSPPVELWRRPIGPGWSSFAVHGDHFYTQEQRGDDEIVACYNTTTGAPVWTHRDTARFFESNAGAGPRGTPTLSNGRVYTFGATGILNALDAADGAVVWSRDAAPDGDGTPSMADGKTKIPEWGFASSPLVMDDVGIVAVAVGGRLVAYDLATGKPRWFGPAGGVSYSSPHLVTFDGVAQVLLVSGAGATSIAPADGKQLWQHPWRGFSVAPTIVQPAVIADGDVLITVSGEGGTRRIAVAHGPGGWTAEERWTSNALKPYFNDFVVHKGHAFGFDGSILASIDLEDGKRQWKGGRYGNGQLVLLPDQDLLLVLSEEGELALVGATPDQYRELARFPAIEGKTWNHPVLVGDVLLVRNGEEMAAFRLSLAGR
jgi:outer membrane protein assembly factor BamB